MSTSNNLPRRSFLAASAGLSAAALSSTAGAQTPSKLAIDGGAKAVTTALETKPRFGPPEGTRLASLMDGNSLFYWKGPQTTDFISSFQEVCPLEHVMTCSSGTAALHIAVAAAGIGPGDEVITAPITDIGTVIGVIYQQGVPVFADLDPHTYDLDPADVKRRITSKTKAIIAVHLCGNPCRLTELRQIADAHGLILIEDCAQAWGAKYRGKPIGSVGHVACWSLQNSKHITTGDGGVVASSDPEIGPKLQMFGDKGTDRLNPGLFESFATNYRMSETQAAVAAGQITRLEGIASTRARLGDRLNERLADVEGIAPHGVDARDRCVYWFYMARFEPEAFTCDRGKFVAALRAEGVRCSPGYIRVPLQKNPVFLNHGFFNGRWPVKEFGLTDIDYNTNETPEAEAILAAGIRVHIHETMPDAHIEQTADAFEKVAAHYRA